MFTRIGRSRTFRGSMAAVITAFAGLAAAPATAQVGLGTTFSYQGQIKQGGNAITGTADFQFRLFDAAAAGTQIGSTNSVNAVSVSGGLFNATLDFGQNAWNGPQRYLEIAVRSPAGSGSFTTMTTRQAVRTAPIAQHLRLPYAGSTSVAGAAVAISNSAAGSYAVLADAPGSSSVALRGAAVDGYGVLATSSGPSGVGVAGTHESTTGTTAAIYGVTFSNSNGAPGVFGEVAAGSPSSGSRAVWGLNQRGGGYGVLGEGLGANSIGVYGSVSSGTGVYGEGNSASAVGVQGRNTAIGNTGYVGVSDSGVKGIAVTGVGVHGEHQNGNYGQLGTASYGVLGEGNFAGGRFVGTTGTSDGVFATISGGPLGVLANGSRNSGVYGEAASSGGKGVEGLSSFNGTGVFAQAGPGGNGLFAVFNGPGSVATTSTNNIARFAVVTFQGATNNAARIDNTGRGFFNNGTQTGGADLAEAMNVEGDAAAYTPGDVLVISTTTSRTVTRIAEPYSTLVAGVYATKPGVLLTDKHIDDSLEGTVPMGIVGIIPTKVTVENGSIKRGDLLVTSSMLGHAMKGTDQSRMLGAIIGKALDDFTGPGAGVIEVMVNVK